MSPATARSVPVPRLPGLEHGPALLADPYRFIRRKCVELGSDVIEARVLLRPTLLMTGAAAAELFYDNERFERAGAAPEPVRATLFGHGTVQSLDDERHRRRKAALLAALAPAAVARLVDDAATEWEHAVARWPRRGDVVLYRAAQEVLARAVCRWAGVPLDEADARRRTDELVLLFDGAASGLRRHVEARRARRSAERWLATLIRAVRERRIAAPQGTALEAIAALRNDEETAGGAPLAERVAAAELLNLLRPTVAVSVWIVLAAHALATHPETARALDTDASLAAFVQEVRRHYPFFPAVVARVRRAFEWHGLSFPANRRALLDIYGTDHDPRLWERPHMFDPKRFLEREPGPFEFIPQGGGSVRSGHRCPGETVATVLTMQAVDLLANRLRYSVPPQDLEIDFTRLPALPRSGFVIRDVAFR